MAFADSHWQWNRGEMVRKLADLDSEETASNSRRISASTWSRSFEIPREALSTSSIRAHGRDRVLGERRAARGSVQQSSTWVCQDSRGLPLGGRAPPGHTSVRIVAPGRGPHRVRLRGGVRVLPDRGNPRELRGESPISTDAWRGRSLQPAPRPPGEQAYFARTTSRPCISAWALSLVRLL